MHPHTQTPRAALLAIAAKRMGCAPDNINTQATFSELGIDSLSLAEFLFDVEDTFDITLDRQQNQIFCLDDLLAHLPQHHTLARPL